MRPFKTVQRPRDPIFCEPGKLVFKDLSDTLFGVPGRWGLRRSRDIAWLDPAPHEDDIAAVYERYHTHELDAGSPSTKNRKAFFALLQGTHSDSRATELLSRTAAKLPVVREQIRYDQGYLPSRRGRVLDVGCGRGDLVEKLHNLGWDAQGIDFDPEAIKAGQSVGRDVQLGNVGRLGEIAGPFDAVTLFHVIEHVFEPVTLLQNIHNVLRPGGLLVVVTPNLDSLNSRLFGQYWRGLEPPRHLQVFNANSLSYAVDRAGFGHRVLHSSPRDASGMFCASMATRRKRRGSVKTLARRDRLAGDVTLGAEFLLTQMGFKVGEELVLLAWRSPS